MLLSYLRNRLKIIIIFLLCCTIFGIVFYLYSLPTAAVFYAGLLCMILIIVLSIFDLIMYAKKHRHLTRLMKSINITLDELPRSADLIEQDYQELIHHLFDYQRKLIMESDASKTEMIDFYTLWVHQIKTPIAAMSVLLQANPSSYSSQLSHELFKVERYAEVVLQYLRIDSISSDLKLEQYSLDSIVRQAVKKYAPMFIHKKVSLEIKELEVKVITDEKWLTFVIEQLLSNAIKYTNNGAVRIFIEGNKNLVIEDTGIGISQEDLPRIFEKGFTGYNGRMDKKSTGLGLYLCKRIVDKLSHQIKISSAVGGGTKVILDLSSYQSIFE